MDDSNSPPHIASPTLPLGIGRTLAKREVVYLYLSSHYIRQVGGREYIRNGVAYYRCADLSNLLEQSGIDSSKRIGLEHELQEKAILAGYVGRETFVRALEQQGCFRRVYSYCRKNR